LARILIVDDNLMVRTLLRAILESAGHDVVGEAHDGLQAETSVRSLRPDVVTLDLGMPVRGGLDSLPYLLQFDPSPAVVVCSALLTERRVIAALQLGAIGFIVKPFARATVLSEVGAALSQATAPRHASDAGSLPGMSPIPTGEADTDQREFMRCDSKLLIRVTPDRDDPLVTTTVDLSGSGLLLSSGHLALGTRVDFRLELGSGQAPIQGRARVARVDGDGRPALAFEQVSVDDHERLIAHIHSHASPRQVAETIAA
jgi:two-component system chemotaxis response regulator CheY